MFYRGEDRVRAASALGRRPGRGYHSQAGATEQTLYRWKKKFAGLGVAELRRLRQLEEENKKLMALVADLSLDKKMLQDVVSGKVQGPIVGRSW
ncbi:transposase [Lacipirellula parvula]|uniref:Transposase n=1 Tax=Lacipirellula parvula TaxID=2650471 RepID=A0A5K7X5C8_9BACT|nr:transposase [Lacipirellula parvula]